MVPLPLVQHRAVATLLEDRENWWATTVFRPHEMIAKKPLREKHPSALGGEPESGVAILTPLPSITCP